MEWRLKSASLRIWIKNSNYTFTASSGSYGNPIFPYNAQDPMYIVSGWVRSVTPAANSAAVGTSTSIAAAMTYQNLKHFQFEPSQAQVLDQDVRRFDDPVELTWMSTAAAPGSAPNTSTVFSPQLCVILVPTYNQAQAIAANVSGQTVSFLYTWSYEVEVRGAKYL